MTNWEIIDTLARRRAVEGLVQAIAHSHTLSADLRDLCQLVYVCLLSYRADKIMEMWSEGSLQFFIIRIIKNQLFSRTSPFYSLIRKYRSFTTDIDGLREW